MTARAHQALDMEPPALLQASALTLGKSLSGFIPLFLLPMSSAKSIEAMTVLTHFSWKSNPIDTTQLEVNSTYICRRQARPFDSTTQGTESHSQRHVFGTPERRPMALGKAVGQPERASALSISRLHCPPSPQACCSTSTVLAGLPVGDGSKAPTQVGAWSLGSTVPTPTAVCVCEQVEQRGAEGGKEEHRSDGNKKLLLTGQWQLPEVVWTTASKGFLTGGITGCTHIARSQTWPSIQMQMQHDCYPGYYREVQRGNQILTWLQLSVSNAMNTVLNIIGNPAKDNRTTHVLSYGSPQVIPGNLSPT